MKQKLGYLVFAGLTFSIGVILTPFSMPDIPPVEPMTISCIREVGSSEPASATVCSVSGPINLVTIEIRRNDPEQEITERVIVDFRKERVTDLDLDLGESIENQIIALGTNQTDRREFKIEQQFETSMAIGNEGPHINFVNWKHYTSDWKPITKLSGNRFLTSTIRESDYTRFLKVTQKEILRVIAKEDKRWIGHARACKGPNVAPCYVGVSRISFRISAKENDKWEVIHRINFSIPLGC